jgi:hypothetical protein
MGLGKGGLTLVWVTYKDNASEMVGATIFNTWEEGRVFAAKVNAEVGKVYWADLVMPDQPNELFDFLVAEAAELEGVE